MPSETAARSSGGPLCTSRRRYVDRQGTSESTPVHREQASHWSARRACVDETQATHPPLGALSQVANNESAGILGRVFGLAPLAAIPIGSGVGCGWCNVRAEYGERGGYQDDAYVQVVDGQITARFGMEDLIWILDNPQTDVRFSGVTSRRPLRDHGPTVGRPGAATPVHRRRTCARRREQGARLKHRLLRRQRFPAPCCRRRLRLRGSS